MFRLNIFIFTFFCFVLGLSCTCIAQQDSSRQLSIPQIIFNDLEDAVSDGAAFYSAPFEFTESDLIFVGGMLGGTALAMLIDESVDEMILRNKRPTFFYDGAYYISKYGRVLYASLFASALYATGLFTGEDELRTTGRLMLEAMAFAGTLSLPMQIGFGRERPYAGNGAWKYRGVQWDDEYQAFPSGHMTIAFAFSTVLAERVKSPVLRTLIYTVAGLSGAALIYRNQHWTSDIVFGSAFGIASGLFITSREERKRGVRSAESSGWRLIPSLHRVSLVYVF